MSRITANDYRQRIMRSFLLKRVKFFPLRFFFGSSLIRMINRSHSTTYDLFAGNCGQKEKKGKKRGKIRNISNLYSKESQKIIFRS